jgi:hypothetical protein
MSSEIKQSKAYAKDDGRQVMSGARESSVKDTSKTQAERDLIEQVS